MKRLIPLFALQILIYSCQSKKLVTEKFTYTQQKTLNATKGAVVSAHPLASIVGTNILKKGGNAIDAAIATQLALAVVYPNAGNIGGGGFLVAHLANGKELAIDYREKAPAKAHRDMYLDNAGNPITSLSIDGHLAAGVPGTIAGLFASHKYGKLPMEKLLEPAIELAERGFVITQQQAQSLNANKSDFEKNNFSPTSFVRSTPWKAGDTLVQPELAATLKRIKKYGAAGFYEGETADLIVKEMAKNKGIISHDDLKNYQAVERQITSFDYKGYKVLTMPLPSSGGIILQQMLKMIEHRNIGAMGFQTPASVQLMTEVERRAYADRANYLGDPDFVKVPVKTLTSETYLRDRMADYRAGVAGKSTETVAGKISESSETTHLSVVDNEGNAVAVTTTLNGNYGSHTVVSGAGFLLNNEMDDFSVKPGSPNMYGAVGNEKNAIAPNKRMLSSMTPTIVLKEGQPFIVVGTPGGTTIPTSVFQAIVNIIDFKMSPDDAINKPKFHHQWLPDNITIEKGFDKNTLEALKQMGYTTKPVNQIGRTEIILINRENNVRKITAVADRRGDDDARGY